MLADIPLLFADVLLDRNIPNATKIYEDKSGVYYGVYLAGRTHPNKAEKHQVKLQVIAIRKPNSDGVIFKLIPHKLEDYYTGKIVEGYLIDESEITRFNNHIYPALRRAFPESKSESEHLGYRMAIYLDAHHFEPVHIDGHYYVEEELFTVSFYRYSTMAEFRPSYELRGKSAGIHAIPTVTAALNTRELQQTTVTGKKENILRMYSNHAQILKEKQKTRIHKVLTNMNEARQQGIVYKSGEFWKKYKLEMIKHIFSGDFGFVEHPLSFVTMYLSYVDGYYQECKNQLPSERVSYTEEWYEKKYGVSSKTGEYYVEMEPRFAKNFEVFMDIRDSKNRMNLLTTFVDSFTRKSSQGGLSFVGDLAKDFMQDMADGLEMRKFIKDVGCSSATIKQLGDNLIAAANGNRPVQQTGRYYSGAALESNPYKLLDAQQFYDLTLRKRAKDPKKGPNGWQYMNEELDSYKVGVYAKDGRTENKRLHKIGIQIQLDGFPVLRCYYGPTGFNSSGNLKHILYLFWYDSFPVQIKEYLAARHNDNDVDPGLLHARKDCPANSTIAHNILFGN